jgi:hypothetical protein
VAQSQRRADWPERLAEVVKVATGRPFSWGENDCALFAADCAMAMTGVDPLAHVRGEYSSELGAARVLRRLGCDDVAQLADQVIGARIDVGFAQRGDWLMIEEERVAGNALTTADAGRRKTVCALGVCLGAQGAFHGPDGMGHVRTLACRAAWPVGR